MEQYIKLTKIIPSAWNPWQMWRSELWRFQSALAEGHAIRFSRECAVVGGKVEEVLHAEVHACTLPREEKAYIFRNVVLPSDVTSMDPISSFQL